MALHKNLLDGPDPTLLPEDAEAHRLLVEDKAPADRVAAAHPAYCLAWAELSDQALADGQDVAAYAYARTGYHRGLDQLRRNGWGGHGPIPWAHEGNRGFLRCLAALARASQAIGDVEEASRCREFLRDSSAEAADVLQP